MDIGPPKRPHDRHGFEIGIICALSLEADMVEWVFDVSYPDDRKYGKALNDPNTYTTGVISGHNVVLAYCPGAGNNGAAQTASGLMSSFTNIKTILIVGICGAIPYYKCEEELVEIVLGDCLISTAAVQFDHGRQGPGGFAIKNGREGLSRPGPRISRLMTKLQTSMNKRRLTDNLLTHLRTLEQRFPEKVRYPGAAEDRLYKSSYTHTHHVPGEACEECDADLGICKRSCEDLGCEDQELEVRKKLTQDVAPSIHFGYFGSSNSVIKSGEHRDALASAQKILAFEMEGAGVWEHCDTVIIKSACDYADSHKHKRWQPYAAGTSAAGLKAFLQELDTRSRLESLETSRQVSPPSHYMVPSFQNKRFVGREDELAELEQFITNNEAQKVAIYGLGGVGKTSLALAFCYAVKARYPEYSILWLSALTRERFKQDYRRLAQTYSIRIDLPEDEMIAEVRKCLSSEQAGKWLLILDNIDDESHLFGDNGILKSLPQGGAGFTLFTTRYKSLAVDLAEENTLGLKEMSVKEAKAFLAKLLKIEDLLKKTVAIEELLEELAFLPLAIAQAAFYINKRSITISEYLFLMRNAEDDMVKLLSHGFRDNPRESLSRDAVAVTWLVSFEQIQKDDPIAADLLCYLAFLENKSIPFKILPSTGSKKDLIHAIGTLVGYSFLSRQRNSMHDEGAIYDMHKLVQRASKIWMLKQDIADQWQRTTIKHLAEIFPQGDWEDRFLWRDFMPHAVRVLQEAKPTMTKADLCHALGECLCADGRYPEATIYFQECVSWQDRELSEENTNRLASQNQLAGAYRKNGQEVKAIKLLKHVVAIEARTLAEDHPRRLASQHELASAYRQNDQEAKAMKLLKHVVAMNARTLPEDHQHRLASQHELALVYSQNGQVAEAVELLEHVVAIRTRILAKDHPLRLASQHELALVYRQNGQMAEAIKLLEHVVAIEVKALAKEHPSRLISQHELAITYRYNGQMAEAVELLEHVVATEARTLAEENPSRLTSQYSLAITYRYNGQINRAISLMQRVVAVEQTSLEKDHSDRIGSEKALAEMLIVRTRENMPSGKAQEETEEQRNREEVVETETALMVKSFSDRNAYAWRRLSRRSVGMRLAKKRKMAGPA